GEPRATAPLRAAQVAGLPVVTPLALASGGRRTGRRTARRESAPLTPMRLPIGSRASLASRFGSPPGIETGGPGPGQVGPGTATMLAAGLAPGPPPRPTAAFPNSADSDSAGREPVGMAPADSAAAGGIPVSGDPGRVAGGGAAGGHLATEPLTGTRQQAGAEASDATRSSIGSAGSIRPGATQRAVSPGVTRSWRQAGLASPAPDGGPGSPARAGLQGPAGDDRPWSPSGRLGKGPGARPSVLGSGGLLPGSSGEAGFQPVPNAAPGSPAPPFPAVGPATSGLGPLNPPATSPATTSPAAAGPSGADAADPASLDRLAQRLYSRLRGHLAAELLADREHAQLLTDL
ncbi:MAG TPA: hypothetical protein VII22_00815, partial [Streptosporangiaceae bacterium]